MAQYVADSDAPSYSDEPTFRLILIQEVDEEQQWEGASCFFTMHCRLAQNLIIRKSLWYRTEDEVINGDERKKDTWKIKKLFEKAQVDPKEVVEQDGDTNRLYDEADLKGATLKALIYRDPDSEFLDIFDFLHQDATTADEAGLMKRFEKFYLNKFKRTPTGDPVPEKKAAKRVSVDKAGKKTDVTPDAKNEEDLPNPKKGKLKF